MKGKCKKNSLVACDRDSRKATKYEAEMKVWVRVKQAVWGWEQKFYT